MNIIIVNLGRHGYPVIILRVREIKQKRKCWVPANSPDYIPPTPVLSRSIDLWGAKRSALKRHTRARTESATTTRNTDWRCGRVARWTTCITPAGFTKVKTPNQPLISVISHLPRGRRGSKLISNNNNTTERTREDLEAHSSWSQGQSEIDLCP